MTKTEEAMWHARFEAATLERILRSVQVALERPLTHPVAESGGKLQEAA